MKRFLKVILIIALVSGILGLGFTVGGVAMGATVGDIHVFNKSVEQVRDQLTNDDEEESDDEDEDNEDTEEDAEEDFDETEDFDITKNYPAASVSQIDCDLKYEELILHTWDRDEILVGTDESDSGKFRVSDANGILKINSNRKEKDSTIEIWCPKEKEFQEIRIQLGAGTVEMNGDFKSEKMEVNAGAGTFTNYGKLDIKEADFTVGVGSAEITGLTVDNLGGECGMGSMDIKLAGKDTDYNYELTCGVGELDVDGALEKPLVSGSRKVTNPNAGKTVSLDCGMGEIDVTFDR